MKKNNKGFTLAELLIVVAIIAVLVAIAIPVFTTQLEKSREATDLANVRSAYAGLMTEYLTNGQSAVSTTVPVNQRQPNWQQAGDAASMQIAGDISGYAAKVDVPAGTTGNYTVTVDASGVCTVSVG